VFSSTPLQRSRTPKIQDQCHHTIEKARHSSNTGCIQRRFESQQTLEDRSSRSQSEKSGSKIQVLRQPDRVVRQPEESSSIEACTYLQPLIHSTPYTLTSIVKKAVTMLCATGKRRRIGLQQAKRWSKATAVVKNGATGDTSVLCGWKAKFKRANQRGLEAVRANP
jgi:hypothetical protein